MKVSTRGRYALRILVDLAEHQSDGYIPMKIVAERQNISLKYLEQIIPVLAKNQYVQGIHGKGGGYKLIREPENIIVGDVLRLTEGDVAPVACLVCDAPACDRCESCRTLPMWKKLGELISGYLDSVTIRSLMQEKV